MIIVNHDRIPVEGATTRIKNPKAGNAADAIKSFNFDYSYWSKEVGGRVLHVYKSGKPPFLISRNGSTKTNISLLNS